MGLGRPRSLARSVARLASVAGARRGVVPFASAAAAGGLGAGAIAISSQGTGNRPLLAGGALAVGVAAAVMPPAAGVPVAVVLGTFDAFLREFGASWATYWNEVFVAAIVVRSLAARRPARWEVVVACAVAVAYGAYLAAGSSLSEVFWGAKVLLTSLVLMWAVCRSGLASRVWDAAFAGLAVAVVAQVVLAAWQRHEGIDGLRRLGFAPAELETTSHGLRVFGGFASPAAFSFAIAIALLVWCALALGEPDARRAALAAPLVAPACLVGLVWAEHRTAFAATLVAAIVVSVRQMRAIRHVAVTAAGVAVVAGVLLLAGGGYRQAARNAFSVDSVDARFRLGVWRAYLDDLAAGGRGPAASGSAYTRAHGPARRPLPLAFGVGRWGQRYTRTGVPYRWFYTPATIVVRPPTRARPPATMVAQVTSYRIPRTLAVRHGRTRLWLATIPTGRYVRVGVPLPGGRGPARLELVTRPGSEQARGDVDGVAGAVAFQLRAPHVVGFRPAPTAAERVAERRGDPSAPAGVVDNQYVSWLFAYGVPGGLVCLAWIALFLVPLGARVPADARTVGARLVGVFLVVAAFGVNAWEEAPTDFQAALLVGPAVAAALRRRKGGSRLSR